MTCPVVLNTRGLTTGPIPTEGRRLEILFDFVNHKLVVSTSEGTEKSFPLEDGLSVALFYSQLFTILGELGMDVEILAKPYDNESTIPFPGDEEHHSYDKVSVEHYWQILTQKDHILRYSAGGFVVKRALFNFTGIVLTLQ